MSVAMGRPALFLKINLAGLALYVLMLAAGIAIAGIVGAALAWTFLNVFYVAYGLRRAHAVLNLGRATPWAMRNFGIYAAAGLISFLAGAGAARWIEGYSGTILGLCVASALYAVLSLKWMSPALRDGMLRALPFPRAGGSR
jgi:hypothetical protein